MTRRFRRKQMVWSPLGESPGFPNFTERRGQIVTVVSPVNEIEHLFEVVFEDGTETRGFEFELKPVPRKEKDELDTGAPVEGSSS